jgi:tetratricopeptide (TPR) repeat protein
VASASFTTTLRGLHAVGLIEVGQSGSGTDPSTAGAVPTASPLSREPLAVHPVVVDICRAHILALPPAERAEIAETAIQLLAAATRDLRDDRPSDWPAWELLLPHVAATVAWLAPHLGTAGLEVLLAVCRSAFASLWGIGGQSVPEAEGLARAEVEAARLLGEGHPAELAARHDLANALFERDKLREAEDLFRAVLAGRSTVLAPEHHDTLVTRDRLIGAILLQERFAEAETLYRELLQDMVGTMGGEHPETLSTRVDLAYAVGMQGRADEAADICRDVVETGSRILGESDLRVLDAQDDLAMWVNEMGGHAEAERLCRELLEIEHRVLGPDHLLTLSTKANLARSAAGLGQVDEAEQELLALLGKLEQILPERHYRVKHVRKLLSQTTAARLGLNEPAGAGSTADPSSGLPHLD